MVDPFSNIIIGLTKILGGGAFAKFAATVIVNLATAAIFGKILAPNRPKSAGDKGLQDLISDNVASRRVAYGECIVGGPYAVLETEGDNNHWLKMIVPITTHPVEDILGIFIDDEYVNIAGNDDDPDTQIDKDNGYFVISGKFGGTTYPAIDVVKIIKNCGWGWADYQYVTDETIIESGSKQTPLKDQVRSQAMADNLIVAWDPPASPQNRDSGTGLYGEGYKLTNCAHIFVALKWNRDVFAGFPKLKFHIKGKRLYNPKKDSTLSEYGGSGQHRLNDPDTWEYSDDWTLCCLDYLLNKSYGLGARTDGLLNEIDWKSFIDSYVVSSNTIDTSWFWRVIRSLTQGPRYTVNGIFETSSTPIAAMEALITSGGGNLVYAQGKYKIFPAAYRAPGPNDIINEDMIVSPLQIRTHTPRSEIFNKAAGIYTDIGYNPYSPITNEPDSAGEINRPKFEPTDFAIVDPLDSSGTNPYEVQDGEEIIKTFDFPFTIKEFEAQRLARIQLERARRGMVISFEGTLDLIKYSVMDTVYLEILSDSKYLSESFYNRLGLDAEVQTRPDSPYTAYYKQFVIMEMEYTENSTIAITLLEEQEEIYDWNEGMAVDTVPALESAIPLADPTGPILVPIFNVNSPDDTLVEEISLASGTLVRTYLRWSAAVRDSGDFDALDGDYISHYNLEYGVVTDPSQPDPADRVTVWRNGGTKASEHGVITQGPLILPTLYADGVTYDFRVRAVDYAGRRSAWAYYSVDSGAGDYSPSIPPASTVDFYYIKPLNGTAIKNGSGTLTIEAHLLTGGIDTHIQTGTIQLYDPDDNLVSTASPGNYLSPSDGYTGVLGTNEINGSKVITLKDGVSGEPLDTIALVDVQDGVVGSDAIYGYIEATNGLAWTQATNGGTWSPDVDYTNLDVTFIQGGSEVARWSRRIDRDANGILTDGGAATHTSGNLNVGDIAVDLTGSPYDQAFTVKFTYNKSPFLLTVTETVITSVGADDGYDSVTFNYTNNYHRVNQTGQTTWDWTGSGGNFYVYEGPTLLNLDSNTQSTTYPSTPGTYHLDITEISGDTLTEPTITGAGSSTAIIGDWAGSLNNETVYRITARIHTNGGFQVSYYTNITLTPIDLVANTLRISYTNELTYVPFDGYREFNSDETDFTIIGTFDWTDTGGELGVFEGPTLLVCDSTTQQATYPSTPGTYHLDLVPTNGGLSGEPTITKDSPGTTVTFGDWSGSFWYTRKYDLNVYVRTSTGTEELLTQKIYISRNQSGNDGKDAIDVNYAFAVFTAPVSNRSISDLSATAGPLYIYEGAQLLSLDSETPDTSYPSTPGSFNMEFNWAWGDTLTVPSFTKSSPDGTTVNVAAWGGTLLNSTIYTLDIYAHTFAGDFIHKPELVMLVPSKEGDSSVAVNYTNNSHSVPVTNLGNPSWGGSGGKFYVFDGTELLDFQTNGQNPTYPSGAGQYNLDIEYVSGDTLSEPSITGEGTTEATIGDWAGSGLTQATVYRINAYIHSATGNLVLYSTDVTLTPSKEGLDTLSISYTNNAHSVPVTNRGVEDWVGSGGTIEVVEGFTTLTLDSTTQSPTYPSTPGTYHLDLVKVSGNSPVNEPNITTNSPQTQAILGNWSGKLIDVTVYQITAYVRSQTGNTKTISTSLSLTPSNQGSDSVYFYATNSAHSVEVDNTGTVTTWNGSGGNLQFFEGPDALVLDSTTQSTDYPSTPGSYNLDITPVIGDTLTEPTITTDSPATTVTLGNWDGTLTTTTLYRATAYITQNDGTTTTMSVDLTLTPSHQGNDGRDGVIVGGIRINQNAFTFASGYDGWMYIHGLANTGAPADVDGSFVYKGEVITLPKGSIHTAQKNFKGFLVYDTNIASYYATRYYTSETSGLAVWEYDDGSSAGWQTLTLNNDLLIIGTYVATTEGVIDQATLGSAMTLNSVVITAAHIETASLSALSITTGFLETRPDTGGASSNTTPRLTLNDAESPITIFGQDDETILFSITDIDDGQNYAVLSLLGDFQPGSLNTARAFSEAGIADLRARLGLYQPTSGQGTGGTIYVNNLPLTVPTTQTTTDLDQEAPGAFIHNAGSDIELNFTFTDSDNGIYTAPTADTWRVHFEFRANAGTWYDIPSATFDFTGRVIEIFPDEGYQEGFYYYYVYRPLRTSWNYWLSKTGVFTWSPPVGTDYASGELADNDTVEIRVVTERLSGTAANIPKLIACAASEEIIEGGVAAESTFPISAAEISAGVNVTTTSAIYGSIQRYGAVGDGATDDTAAIQDAFDVAGTYPVYIPKTLSYYKITSAIRLPDVEGVNVYGEGTESLIVQATAGVNCIMENTNTTVRDVTMKDFSLGVASAINAGTALQLWNISDSYFENIDIVTTNSATGGYDIGFDVFTGSGGTGGQNNEFKNCRVTTIDDATSTGYRLWATTGVSCKNNRISGGLIKSNLGDGVYIFDTEQGSPVYTNHVIDGVSFEGTMADAINCPYGSGNVFAYNSFANGVVNAHSFSASTSENVVLFPSYGTTVTPYGTKAGNNFYLDSSLESNSTMELVKGHYKVSALRDTALPGFEVELPSATNPGFGTRVTGDTSLRLQILADGDMSWGAGDSSGADVGIKRSSAGILQVYLGNLDLNNNAIIGSGSGGPRLYSGSGDPEGVISAPIGSLYCRTDGSAAATLYIKESNDSPGNTGWQAAGGSGAFTVPVSTTKYFNLRTATTAELTDVGSDVNTDPGKQAGSMVFNLTTLLPVWSQGSDNDSLWVYADGTSAYEPTIHNETVSFPTTVDMNPEPDGQKNVSQEFAVTADQQTTEERGVSQEFAVSMDKTLGPVTIDVSIEFGVSADYDPDWVS